MQYKIGTPIPSDPAHARGPRGSRKPTFRAALFKSILIAAAFTTFTASASAAQMIGVNFQGRVSDGSNVGTDPLLPEESAGAVPQGNWNNIDDSTFATPEKGTSEALVDSAGTATPITITFDANDSWNNDTDPASITTPNARMMNGIIKRQGVGTSSTFTFNNVPEGQYDVYVYLSMNGDNVRTDITDQDHLQTYYAIEPHQFLDTDTLKQVTSQDPAAPQLGSYVKLSKLATYGRGKIAFSAKYVANGDGNGVAGIQLVNAGPAVANTNLVTITRQPASRTAIEGGTATFTVEASGPIFGAQWYKGSTAIANATNLTYTTPALVLADNGSTYHLVLTNNVNSVQSSTATLGVVENKFTTGVLKYEYFPGQNRAAVEAGTAGEPSSPGSRVGADRSGFITIFETGVDFADNYANRISGFFLPPQDGNYVFFVSSDDDSDLFLSTDENPANRKLIAAEATWSGNRQWLGGGNSPAEDKRSDLYAGTQWPDGNVITLKKGQKYYIEAVHAEGGGGDNLGVTYKLESEDDSVVGTNPSRLTGNVIAANVPQVMILSPATVGFNTLTFNATDVGPSQLDPASVKVTFDGQVVVPTAAPKTTNGITAFTYTYPARLIPGSTHTFLVEAKDLGGNPASSSGSVTLPLPLFPAGNLPGPAVVNTNWVSRFIFNNTDENGTVIQVGSLAAALSAIDAASKPGFTGTVVDVVTNVVNWGGTAFMFGFNAYPDEAQAGEGWTGDDVVNLNVAHIVIPEEGDYTFGVHSDDGMAVRILGAEAISVNGGGYIDPASPDTFAFPGTTGDSNTRAVYHLKKGVYRIEFVWYERGGGDGGEIYAAKGAFTTDASTSTWRLIGDPTPSETLTLLGVDAKGWTVISSDPGGDTQLTDWATAQEDLDTTGGGAKTYDVLNVGDPDTNAGVLAAPKDRPGTDDDDYALKATATLVVPADGDYLLGFDTDDGAYMKVEGQNFIEILQNSTTSSVLAGDTVTCDCLTGDSGTTMTIHLAKGNYPIEVGMFERGGGSFLRASGSSIPITSVLASQIPALAKGGSGGTFATPTSLKLTNQAAGQEQSTNTTITVTRSGTSLSIAWAPAGGTLQKASSLGAGATWSDVGTANPATVTIGTGNAFYRVKK